MLLDWVRNQISVQPMLPAQLDMIRKFTPAERQGTLHCHPTLVAEIYGEVIGYASYYLDDEGTFYHGALRILPDWQRERVGTLLMKARVEIAKDFHCPQHRCLAWNDKPIMQRICLDFGMRPELHWSDRTLYIGSLVDAR
jgi:GNAT superfamily N-acetyltransferase